MDTRIVEVLQAALPDLIAVYVFGSAGTAYERADSDLDLAFLTGRNQDPVSLWKLAQQIATLIGRDVDLIDLRAASTVMVAQVISEGRQLLCVDTSRCAEFEMYALADYARLNEERRGILDDIHARASVYG